MLSLTPKVGLPMFLLEITTGEAGGRAECPNGSGILAMLAWLASAPPFAAIFGFFLVAGAILLGAFFWIRPMRSLAISGGTTAQTVPTSTKEVAELPLDKIISRGQFQMRRSDDYETVNFDHDIQWESVTFDWTPKEYLTAGPVSPREIVFRHRYFYAQRPDKIEVFWVISEK